MPEPQNFRDFVDNISQMYGDKTALQIREETGYQKYSYKTLGINVRKIAAFLNNHGLKKGGRAAILSENRPEWGLAYLAIIYAGGTVIPLDTALKSEELAFLINDSGAEFIFFSEKFFPLVESFKNQCPALKNLINFDSDAESLNQLQLESPPVKMDLNDLATIVYTSGTTGNPKGVMLTQGNLLFEMASICKVIKFTSVDRTLSVLPLHHTFECTTDFLLPLYVGAEVTYIQSLKSSRILEAMQETKTTIFVAVPLLFQLIYNGIFLEIKQASLVLRFFFGLFWFFSGIFPVDFLRKLFFRKLHKKFGGALRFMVSGGAAIDYEILAGFRRFGFEIIQGYGLTEAAPVVSANRLEDNLLGSIGLPLPGVEVKINQPNSEGIGELLVKGANVMSGYHQRPDLTAEVLKNGWLYTGDLVKQDKKGHLFIVGRIKDLIVSASGQNVYPDEIELEISRNPEIGEICVFGQIVKTGFKKGSEEVFAVIRPNEKIFGELVEEKRNFYQQKICEIIDNYNRHCPSFKRIENYRVVLLELPKTSTKKIRRNLVKKIWEDLK